MSDKLVMVRSFISDIDALLCKSRLESEGIPSVMLKDDAGGMEPQFQLTLGIRLMVRGEDLPAAREILGGEGS